MISFAFLWEVKTGNDTREHGLPTFLGLSPPTELVIFVKNVAKFDDSIVAPPAYFFKGVLSQKSVEV